MNKRNCEKCRLCLSLGDKDDFVPIFNENDDSNVSLAVRIMVCLSLPIQAKDSFPLSVCRSCEDHVIRFYSFREICYDSYHSLLQGEALNNAKDKLCSDREKDDKNFNSVRIEADNTQEDEENDKAQLEESDLNSQQNESYLHELNTSLDRRSLKKEESDSQITQNDEIITTNPEKSDNPNYKSERLEEKPLDEERTSEEIHFVEDEQSIVKYKCLACDNVFPDLDSASIHCAECSHSEANVSTAEQRETEEYLDESYEETMENCENLGENEAKSFSPEEKTESLPSIQEETHLSLEQNKNVLSNAKKERRKSSSITRKKLQDSASSHSCPDCESVFSSAALLRRHTVIHTGERPYECSICKKRFSQVGQLNFHRKFHENPRYRCDICKKPFLRPSDIDKHMRTHTGEKPYGCVICSKSFAQLVALQQHERVHTGDKPFDCEICGKKFSQKANKTKHVKIHKEGAKPHTCEVCGRSFSDLEEMNLHRAGHGGGKPRKCNYCEESFRKMSELAQHIRRYHTFERPHKCAFCQKAFYSLYNLKQHVMVHTGQKPYACSHCDLKFTQKGNLTKHFDRKHMNKYNLVVENEEVSNEEMLIFNDNSIEEINLYACSRCDMKFREKETLIVHFERKHGDSSLNKIKYFVIKREFNDEGKNECVSVMEDNLTENANETLIIEREETVNDETGEENVHHNNLQIYEMAE